MLEPDEAKVSRPVLRGLGTGNSPRLPDISPVIFSVQAAPPLLIFHTKTCKENHAKNFP